MLAGILGVGLAATQRTAKNFGPVKDVFGRVWPVLSTGRLLGASLFAHPSKLLLLISVPTLVVTLTDTARTSGTQLQVEQAMMCVLGRLHGLVPSR
ncbi:hypothetical protein CHU98_g3749 [Xylaria longipes]|nr:hypothetical protein CHU98_g3749 [Xylaria longipes]